MLFCLGAFAAWAGPSQGALDGGLKTLDRDLNRLAEAPNLVGLGVCVAAGGGVVYQRTEGSRELGATGKVDAQTRFRIASLSKGFASTLALMLAREEVLSLDDRVAEEVNYFVLADPAETARVKLEHLLSHRVGLPHYAYDRLLESNWSVENIVRRYQRLDPVCPVGTCYGYQNTAYNLVTDMIEARTGRVYEDLVAERLFQPLEMRDSGFGDAHLKRGDNWARPHIGRGSRLRPVDVKPNYYRLSASAGINASTADMCRWLLAQLGARPDVIVPDLLAATREPRVETRRELYRGRWRRARLDGAHYGLGWRLYDYAGRTLVFHAGSVQGYGATIALLADEPVGLVALWNSESSRPWGIVPTFVDAYLGLKPKDWMKLESLDRGSSMAAAAGSE